MASSEDIRDLLPIGTERWPDPSGWGRLGLESIVVRELARFREGGRFEMVTKTKAGSLSATKGPPEKGGSKVVTSAEEAVGTFFDGARVMVGGFGLCGNAEALIAAVVDHGVKDLHLISNNAGNMGKGLAAWLRAKIVAEVTCTYLGNNEDLHSAMADGSVKINVIPQGTFVERIRAAGAGIAGFYTPTGVGTVVAEGKETRQFNGRTFLLEEALPADFALIRCHRADTFGNARFWRTARNFSPLMAMAAETSIIETDQLLELGGIDPHDVHLPGIFVQRIVEVQQHEDPFEYRTTRPRPGQEG